MKPEPRDPNIRVTRADIADAVRAVGVVPGDTAIFHSSLSSMGTVVDGPVAVIDGFADAVGSAGTVAVPTLCPSKPEGDASAIERWDPETTPSYVGLITETLRARSGAFRSDHHTHSITAIGRRAVELTRDHGAAGPRPSPFGTGAFARESPWQRLIDWNAAYCFIGVTFRVNTMVHCVEATLAERALDAADPDARDCLAAELAGWEKPGPYPSIRVEDRETIEEMLAGEGLMTYGKIGSATLRCCRADAMVERWVAIVEQEPERWLPDDYIDWLAKCPR
ncbi:MAG TPA: AAC(3) family N-acetyltransferase [Armatimonadota bacterium]|nr:AAC(3) family N-acetyltransferase [Armatimonadota bacterium]